MAEPATENIEMVNFKAGDVVMKEGKLGEGLFILMSGTVAVTVKGVKVAEISDKGSYVGEIASVLRCRRIATVKALTDAKFMVVKNVTRYFEQNPSAALGIAQALAARIMEMNEKLVTYKADLEKWVQRGEDMVKTQDLGEFRNMLEEMHRLLVDGRAGGEK